MHPEQAPRRAYVIGSPVGHSLSPAIHNAAFAACGVNAHYEAVHVLPEQLGDWVASVRSAATLGFNVTLPHKERILPFLDEVQGDASLTGAVNVVLVAEKPGPATSYPGKPERSAGPRAAGDVLVELPLRLQAQPGGPASGAHNILLSRPARAHVALIGRNSDTAGFRRSLQEQAGETLRGKRVLVLGAGGAGRAVAVVALQDGAERLSVANRHPERAQQLLQILAPALGQTETEALALDGPGLTAALRHAEVIINATSVGLRSEEMPVSPGPIHDGALVLDVVYDPPRTAFLMAAERLGARVVGGLGMLVYQAASAFESWTGLPAPTEVMWAAAERAIGAGPTHPPHLDLGGFPPQTPRGSTARPRRSSE